MNARFVTSRRSILAGMTAVAGSLTLGRTALGMLDAPTGKADDLVAGKSGKLLPFPIAMYGPLVLAADLGPGPKDGPLKIGGYDTAPKPTDLGAPAEAPVAPAGDAAKWIEVVSAKDLTFRLATKSALPVKPMYRITDEKYAVYWGTEKKA